jgi:steroid delta-isomerase-like uncharacterized protein
MSGNTQIVEAFTRAWDAGDIDAFGDYMADDILDHNPMPGLPAGIEGTKMMSGMLLAAFPDMSADVHLMIEQEDRVARLRTIRGTHRGEFMGMPGTGRSIAVVVIDIVRIAGGKVVERWGLLDQAALMGQLGMMPAPPLPEGWTPPPIAPQIRGDDAGNPAANHAAMLDFLDDIAILDVSAIMAKIDENAVDHAVLPGQPRGREGFRFRFEQLFAGLEEPTFEMTVSVAQGPFHSGAYTFSATHTGPLMGIPATGKSFTVAAMDFVRLRDRKLVEHWGLIDTGSMMAQLGLMPEP